MALPEKIPPLSGGRPSIKLWDACIEPIPYPDDTFVKVFAHDFVEHLPRIVYLPQVDFDRREVKLIRRLVIIELLNEVWRVLKPHGIFEVCVPVANHEVIHGDPTHCSVWCQNTFNYICAKHPENFEWALMKAYGFRGRFQRVSVESQHGGSHLLVRMSAVKSEESLPSM